MAQKNSTTTANIRSGPRSVGGVDGNTGSVMLTLHFSFDPTAAAAGTGMYLPKGATVLAHSHDGGATGGTNPTFIIGIASDTNGYITVAPADAAGVSGIDGALADTPTTQAEQIYAGVGASAATGGTVAGHIMYVLDDPDNALNE